MKPARLVGRVVGIVLFLAPGAILTFGQTAPAWWAARGVLNTSASASDYAAVNIGQLKRIASLARDEMQARLTGGAGTAINALVD